MATILHILHLHRAIAMSPSRGAKHLSQFAGRQRGFSDKHLFSTICAVALAAFVTLWWFDQQRAATKAGSTAMTQQSTPKGKFIQSPKPSGILRLPNISAIPKALSRA